MKQEAQESFAHDKKNGSNVLNDKIAPEKITEQEEKFFKLFGIILVLVVFYLPFLSSFVNGPVPQTIAPFYY